MHGLDRASINAVIVLLDRQTRHDMAGNSAPLVFSAGDIAALQIAGIDHRKTGLALIDEFQKHRRISVRTLASDAHFTQPDEVMATTPLDAARVGFISSPATFFT